MGDADAPTDERTGLQAILADEAADETRGIAEAQPQGQRGGMSGGVLIRQ